MEESEHKDTTSFFDDLRESHSLALPTLKEEIGRSCVIGAIFAVAGEALRRFFFEHEPLKNAVIKEIGWASLFWVGSAYLYAFWRGPHVARRKEADEFRKRILELEKQCVLNNEKINEYLIDKINAIQNEPLLIVTAGDLDFHREQRATYLQGSITNEGRQTIRGVKARIINFQDSSTTALKDFDLPWSLSRTGPIDIKPGEKAVFDIGVLPSGGYPPSMQMFLCAGERRINGVVRYRGTYPIEIQIVADGVEPIIRKFDVVISEDNGKNKIEVKNKA